MREFFAASNPQATFIINSKTGEAVGQYSINTGRVDSNQNDAPIYETITQNVGDMIRSDYLIIDGRN